MFYFGKEKKEKVYVEIRMCSALLGCTTVSECMITTHVSNAVECVDGQGVGSIAGLSRPCRELHFYGFLSLNSCFFFFLSSSVHSILHAVCATLRTRGTR